MISLYFFQSLSISTLLFPYTQRQIQVSGIAETVLQAREGLKHYQATSKVQKQPWEIPVNLGIFVCSFFFKSINLHSSPVLLQSGIWVGKYKFIRGFHNSEGPTRYL